MKVLFIYPNAGSQTGFNYGVAHMAGVLKAAGHQAACWQLCEDIAPLPDRDAFIAGIRAAAADVVGFSVVTPQWPYARQLAAWARQATAAPLICGGIHAGVAGEEVLASGLFDAIMVGECDEAILDYVQRLGSGRSTEDMPNLGTRRPDGSVRINPVRPLPELR
ncbi:MAG: hypothetical protein GX591_15360, partial [Planctomycetes bacterium]|nr:hypothetical protein [Planctomycetota bacterium]